MPSLKDYDFLVFDCYGTLIDWESGILKTIRPFAKRYQTDINDERLLETYARLETEIESGKYLLYKEVLGRVMLGLADEFGWTLSGRERDALADSVKDWIPFPDTVASLQTLERHFKLNILSNIDDDLFAHSATKLGVDFHRIITAQQVGSYKPSRRNFQTAIEIIGPPERILHVAQSLFHDIVPAQELGLATAWINRRKDKKGFGATPEAFAEPNWEFESLAAMVEEAEGQMLQD